MTTAAMESTRVYWIPVDDVLEQHGIQPCLGNPRNMKNVPGKRTDFHECQWIQHLHSMGLLHAAFRPDAVRRLQIARLAQIAPHQRNRDRSGKRLRSDHPPEDVLAARAHR